MIKKKATLVKKQRSGGVVSGGRSDRIMEANEGMVAGSYKRNELVRIRHDSDTGPKPLKNLDGNTCQICRILLDLLPEVIFLLPAMSVPSQFAGLDMSMRGGMEINPVLSAKLDTKDTKEALESREMMWKMILMT